MSEHKYPQIPITRKDGSEQFIGADISERLNDYWSWSHSDLISNTERGKFAEYLVSLAMKCADGVSDAWNAYDIHSPEDIKIEVKSSAYLQTWPQIELSTILFSIRQARAYDYENIILNEEVKRQSDVYVFCVENCQDQDIVNPLDLSQWDFYVVATRTLNEEFGSQKTLTLKAIEKLGSTFAPKCKFSELRNEILSAYEYQGLPY